MFALSGNSLITITNPRPHQRGRTPTVFPAHQECQEVLASVIDDRDLRDQVLLREDAEPRVHDVQACTSSTREEAAGYPERRGSADDTRAGETAAISSVSGDDLLVRV